MAIINNQPPKAPLWPWGGPKSVRERLVDPSQLDRKKKARAGNPKNPALASAALMDFIGPAHSAEEMRLPLPPYPGGNDAPLEGFTEQPHLQSVAARAEEGQMLALERCLARVNASPERKERLMAVLQREAKMLEFVGKVASEVEYVRRCMKQEQQTEGY